jgi:sugar phosphate permease
MTMAIPSAATTLSSVNISPSATVDLDATYRKIAWRIMPFLMLCYVVAYLDRTRLPTTHLT